MTIARKLEDHLNRVGVDYHLISHPYSSTSKEAAHKAHIPTREMIKGIVVHDGDQFHLTVIPVCNRLVIPWLNSLMNGHFELVGESTLKQHFDDCEEGAIPALGQVYGMPVIWDESLQDQEDFYFESGDHQNLVHLDRGSFMQLMGLQEHGVISCAEEEYENIWYH